MKYLKNDFFDTDKIKIGSSPCLFIRPKIKADKYKTIIFYHGWSSSADKQAFRGGIFASYGYQVLLPDANYHGERIIEGFDYDKKDLERIYLPKTLMSNIIEAPQIFEGLIKDYKADENEIAVAGHSMGAMTAGCLYSFNKKLKLALLFNGTMNLEPMICEYMKMGENSEEYLRIYEFLKSIDPIKHIENFPDRPLLMLNGAEDKSINPAWQEAFYTNIKKSYNHKDLIKFEKMDYTPHILTTQMLEEAIRFARKVGF